MKKKRIVVIAGIRSHYMKLAVFQRAAERYQKQNGDCFDFVYINAGQHYDYVLAGGFIEELNVKFDLCIQYDDKDFVDIFAEMFRKLSRLLAEEHEKKPFNYAVVFGDANTTMIAALAANKQRISVVHIEAGVRRNTFRDPEESNSIVADHLAELCFASTPCTLKNLQKEGLGARSFFSGDIIFDLVKEFSPLANGNDIHFITDGIEIDYKTSDFILVQLHREENINKATFEAVFSALQYSERKILFLAHKRLKPLMASLQFDTKNICVVDFISYINSLKAIKNCAYLITDSGTMPREAFFLGKRSLLRQNPPYWQNLVEHGIDIVIGTERDEIINGMRWAEENKNICCADTDDFGNGNAMTNILEMLKR
ncbi:MAG: UDP-N-acetylglucosamine 2-epimerase [Spirochaetaceae bacterium]|jgi:UDP-N-acetylglucosamine 2-epimerase|nr:UDP-N-acetylglucosamine 2-epimerase [Spirochaetaceae bacterium]